MPAIGRHILIYVVNHLPFLSFERQSERESLSAMITGVLTVIIHRAQYYVSISLAGFFSFLRVLSLDWRLA